MDFSLYFSWVNNIAVFGWILLIAVPKRSNWVFSLTGAVIPVVLGVFYGALMLTTITTIDGGGYSSIQQVRTLFSNDATLLAGWMHYLGFDLFVGTFIAKQADSIGMSRLIQVPFFLITFLLGPLGLAVYVLTKSLWLTMFTPQQRELSQ